MMRCTVFNLMLVDAPSPPTEIEEMHSLGILKLMPVGRNNPMLSSSMAALLIGIP
jgi:hypothetical protein